MSNKVLISAIYAVAENGVIGRHNEMPWYLPADFKHFKKTTIGSPIIMGRKTYDSIGRPLPSRTNIVISRNKALKIDGCLVANSLVDAIMLAKVEAPDEIFIAGGATIYREAMSVVNRIYQTVVHISPIGDSFFQLANPEKWMLISSEYHEGDKKNLTPYSFQVLERK